MATEKVVVVKTFCQYCKKYSRKTKMCSKTGTFAKRKGTCEEFERE